MEDNHWPFHMCPNFFETRSSLGWLYGRTSELLQNIYKDKRYLFSGLHVQKYWVFHLYQWQLSLVQIVQKHQGHEDDPHPCLPPCPLLIRDILMVLSSSICSADGLNIPCLKPCPQQQRLQKLFLMLICIRHGTLRRLLSDNGLNILGSQIFADVCRTLAMKGMISPYQPQINGQIERFKMITIIILPLNGFFFLSVEAFLEGEAQQKIKWGGNGFDLLYSLQKI